MLTYWPNGKRRDVEIRTTPAYLVPVDTRNLCLIVHDSFSLDIPRGCDELAIVCMISTLCPGNAITGSGWPIPIHPSNRTQFCHVLLYTLVWLLWRSLSRSSVSHLFSLTIILLIFQRFKTVNELSAILMNKLIKRKFDNKLVSFAVNDWILNWRHQQIEWSRHWETLKLCAISTLSSQPSAFVTLVSQAL